MKKVLISITLCVATVFGCSAWSQKGHDVTAFIAEQHLTPAARAAVDSILDGRSMVYWANWLDNASHTPEYAYSKTWHYRNIDADQTYESMPKNPQGDVVDAIRYNIGVLGDPANNDAAAKALALKMLVHCVGDMHQPLHMGRKTDLGGNRVKVKYFGRDTNLHSIWDGSLIESAHKWGYSEWGDQIDRLPEEQQVLLLSGNVDDWAKDTYDIAKDAYKEIPEGYNVGYNDVARWAPVIEDQLLRGGLRLAHILNSIYDPNYANAKPLTEF